MPSFFVVGAQKSGTTAFMGLMLFHPQFKPPRFKEGHYFDQGLGPTKSAPSRARSWLRGLPAATHDPYIFTGDATPAYMLVRTR